MMMTVVIIAAALALTIVAMRAVVWFVQRGSKNDDWS